MQTNHQAKQLCVMVGILLSLFLVIIAAGDEQGFQGDRELLRLVVETNKNNLAKIGTWQGEGTIALSIDDAGNTTSLKATGNFVLDRNLDAARSRVDVQSKAQQQAGESASVSAKPYSVAYILNQGKFFDCLPTYETQDGKIHNGVVIWPKEKYSPNRTDEQLDPMEYLKHRNNLMFMYHNSASVTGLARVERIGDIVKFERSYIPVNMPESGLNVFQYEYDLSKGGNVTRYRCSVASEGYESVETCSYKEVKGVFLPDVYTHEYRNGRREGAPDQPLMTKTKRVEFFKHIVNESVDPNEFTIQKLGLEIGAPIADRIAGIAYEYGRTPDGRDVHALNLDVLDLEDALARAASSPNEVNKPMTPEVAKAAKAEVNSADTNLTQRPHSERLPLSRPAKEKSPTRFWVAGVAVLALIVVGLVLMARGRNR